MARLGTTSSAIVLASATALGCGASVPAIASPESVLPASPLGPSYVLIPAPSDDSSLLGRILPALPEPGQALDQIAAPNPCAEHLEPERALPMTNQFDDAAQLGVGVKAHATLATFGFQGSARHATHFVYRLTTQQRRSRLDTTAYLACCKERGCGVGYVSALVYGEGEYASAQESSGSGGVNLAIASVEGDVSLQILQRRRVRGWVAAIVKTTDPALAGRIGPTGSGAIAGVTEESLPQQVKAIYEAGKIEVRPDQSGGERSFVFATAGGTAITEREFARRYRAVVESDRLDSLDTPWVPAGVYVAGAFAVGAGAIATWGFLNLSRPCEPNDSGGFLGGASSGCSFSDTGNFDPGRRTGNGAGQAAALIGTVVFVAATGATLGLYFSSAEGEPPDHRLSEYEARVLAGQYNRALLRKAARDLERVRSSASQAPAPRLMLSIGQGGAGVGGTF